MFKVYITPSKAQGKEATLKPPLNQTVFEVAEGESILSASKRHGLTLPFGCERGQCRTCMASLQKGEIAWLDQQPQLSSREIESGKILLCQALALSDLSVTLDIENQTQAHHFKAEVVRFYELSQNTLSVVLSIEKNERLWYHPGQYLELCLKEQNYAFSIANSPMEGNFIELHLAHQNLDKAIVEAFENALKNRALLNFFAPLGLLRMPNMPKQSSPFTAQKPQAVFIAGGVGLSPFHAMLNHSIYEYPHFASRLYWGVQGLEDLHSSALIKWQHHLPNFSFHLSFSSQQKQKLSALKDNQQYEKRLDPSLQFFKSLKAKQVSQGIVIDALIADLKESEFDFSQSIFYLAGSWMMVQKSAEKLADYGIAPSKILSDFSLQI